jgi:DNA-binding HxlR family transcriptional regulator
LQQIEEFHQARANKLRERDLHVSINKMHIHMSETQLKEEEEEGIKQREEARRRKN